MQKERTPHLYPIPRLPIRELQLYHLCKIRLSADIEHPGICALHSLSLHPVNSFLFIEVFPSHREQLLSFRPSYLCQISGRIGFSPSLSSNELISSEIRLRQDDDFLTFLIRQKSLPRESLI